MPTSLQDVPGDRVDLYRRLIGCPAFDSAATVIVPQLPVAANVNVTAPVT
jgi:hypothetical protein